MNQREWKKLNKEFRYLVDWSFYRRTRKIQRSLQFNKDCAATVLHHLRDTEEQRKYNDEHYELWGHNLDGTFEYGKYVIFVTKEEHTEIHRCSEETRRKISENHADVSGENNPMYGKHHSDETRKRMKVLNSHVASDELRKKRSENATGENNPMYGKHHSDETKKKISEALKGEKNPWYGKHHSEERNAKLSDALKGREFSEEHKQHLREAWKTQPPVSDETREKMSRSSKGRAQSDETRLKRRFSLKGKKKSEEHKQHMREAWKRKKESQHSNDDSDN